LHLPNTGENWEYDETVHQLFIDFKKAHDSVRREVLYSILIDFGVPIKLIRLIKMCSDESCSELCIGNSLSGGWSPNGFTQHGGH
jgi:hypothetical protein